MLRRAPAWLSDLVLIGVAGAYGLGTAWHEHGSWPALVATGAGVLLLARRRQFPTAVLLGTAAVGAALGVVDHFGLAPALVFATFTAARRLDRDRSLRLTVLGALGLGIPAFLHNGHNWAILLPPAAFFTIAWLVGENMHAAELERDERGRQAVEDERARIARELHDVVTHNVSVMVVQAAAGNDVFDSHPDRAREALQAVEETGRRALGELRKLLDVTADGEGILPQPGLARIDELISHVRSAGLAVGLTVEGTPREVPEALDLSAYRIVQEALTNTLKHASATRAEVHVRYENDAVEVEVADNGAGPNGAPNAGRGLIGMRERVNLFGGELRTGPGPRGGFAVHARMPLGAA